jgi:hypothetical protein
VVQLDHILNDALELFKMMLRKYAVKCFMMLFKNSKKTANSKARFINLLLLHYQSIATLVHNFRKKNEKLSQNSNRKIEKREFEK